MTTRSIEDLTIPEALNPYGLPQGICSAGHPAIVFLGHVCPHRDHRHETENVADKQRAYDRAPKLGDQARRNSC